MLFWLGSRQDRSCVCAATTPTPRTTKTKSNPRRLLRSLPQSNQPCFVGRFGCPSARARCEDVGVCALGIQSSVSRKYKCSLSSVRPVASHESDEPRRSNTPGSFLGKRSQHPRQSHLIGEGGDRLASSRLATRSVSEAAIGIPLLFLCPAEPPYLLPSRVVLPGGVWWCGVVRLTTPGNRRSGVFCWGPQKGGYPIRNVLSRHIQGP